MENLCFTLSICYSAFQMKIKKKKKKKKNILQQEEFVLFVFPSFPWTLTDLTTFDANISTP